MDPQVNGVRSRGDASLVTWAWVSLFVTPVVWLVLFLVGDVVTQDGTRFTEKPWIWFVEASASLVVVAPLVVTMTLSVLAWRLRHRVLTLVPAVITIGMPVREVLLTAHDVWPLLFYALALQAAVVLVLWLHGRSPRRRTAVAGSPDVRNEGQLVGR